VIFLTCSKFYQVERFIIFLLKKALNLERMVFAKNKEYIKNTFVSEPKIKAFPRF
jgi:hypothetical protein